MTHKCFGSSCFRYNVIFFILTYLLPMMVMFVSYTLIGRELWGSSHIGELTERQASVILSKRRVSITLNTYCNVLNPFRSNKQKIEHLQKFKSNLIINKISYNFFFISFFFFFYYCCLKFELQFTENFAND